MFDRLIGLLWLGLVSWGVISREVDNIVFHGSDNNLKIVIFYQINMEKV